MMKSSFVSQRVAFLLLLGGSVTLFLFLVCNMVSTMHNEGRETVSLRTNHYVNRFSEVFSEKAEKIGKIAVEQIKVAEHQLHTPTHEHVHEVPSLELSVVTKTEKNPFIRALDARFHADTAMNVKFRSLYPKRLDMWWENHSGGLDQGHLVLGQETTTNTYVGHEFFFTEHGNKENEIARFRMKGDRVQYTIEDPREPPPEKLKHQSDREQSFMEDYFAEKGIHWRHYYGPQGPRPPPSNYMYPADTIGDVHVTSSTESFWVCKGALISLIIYRYSVPNTHILPIFCLVPPLSCLLPAPKFTFPSYFCLQSSIYPHPIPQVRSLTAKPLLR